MSDQQSAISYQLSAISYQLNKLSAISDQLEPSPKGSPHTKGNGSSDLRCVVFLGSPYGANPSTARLWESAPKGGRTGCPRLIFETACLVRSAPGPGTADGRGEPDKDDGPVDRRPGERAHRDVRPGLSRGAGCVAGKFAPSGVSFSLATFSWTSKRK